MPGIAQFRSLVGARFGLGARDNLVLGGEALATIKSVRKTLTSAQILALNATPVTIIPAPGAGRVLIFFGALVFLDYNSTAYDGVATGEDLAFRYTDGSGAIAATLELTSFITLTADTLKWVNAGAAPAATGDGQLVVANAPIVAHMTAGEIATGNSPLYIRAFYMDMPAVLPSISA